MVGARHAAARLLVTLGEHLVRLSRTADAEKVILPISTRPLTTPKFLTTGFFTRSSAQAAHAFRHRLQQGLAASQGVVSFC